MIRVNLLVSAKKKKRLKGIHFEIVVFLAVIALIVLGYLSVLTMMNKKINNLHTEVTRLQKEYQRLQKIKKEVDEFKRKKDEFQQKIDIVKNLKQGQKGYYKLFIMLEKSLPEDIWISSMDLNNGRIKLSGASLRTSSINEFIINLYNSKMFTGIELQVVKKKTVENIDINEFNIDATVNLGGQ